MYYLRSRYYNPTCGRFINADTFYRHNIFLYGDNNPIIFIDPHGYTAIPAMLAENPASQEILKKILEGITVCAGTVLGFVLGESFSNALADPIGAASIDDQIAFYEQGFFSEICSAATKAMAQDPSRWNHELNIHHIVPKSMGNENAVKARYHLANCGISVQDTRNLVPLSRQFHKFLHTDAYCYSINAIFGAIDILAPEEQKNGIAAVTLKVLGDMLMAVDYEVRMWISH